MDTDNPYQAPQASAAGDMAAAAVGGLWRQGKLLVAHRNAQFPDRCVKSNQPANGRRLKRRLYWHHPAVYLAVLVNLLIYVILALALRKTATIYIGLTDKWFWIRRRRIAIAWCLVLGSNALLAAAFVFENGLFALFGLVTFLFAVIYGLVGARMVTVTKMTDTHVWLKGVHPDFLAELPTAP